MIEHVHLQLHVVLDASLQTPGVDAQSGQTAAVDQNVENRFGIFIVNQGISSRHRVSASSEVDSVGQCTQWHLCGRTVSGVITLSLRCQLDLEMKLVHLIGGFQSWLGESQHVSRERTKSNHLKSLRDNLWAYHSHKKNTRKTKHERTPHQDKQHRLNWNPTK